MSWLEGGNAGWEAAGQPLFAGVNVPSKAFAECVEQTCHTPDIEASELDRLRRENADVVVLDTRTREEFGRFHVPGAISVPGSEVVRRFDEVVTSEDTFVVVSCAGRTRGIIGAQALIDAGVPNRIAVLSGGTQGWRLAGLTLERDTPAIAPRALADGLRELARTRTGRLAARSGIGAIDRDELARWRADADRTTYLFDVRSPEEYAEGHGQGFVSAQGGQLVQSLDQWAATRGARIVLTDDDGIRATMTAHWLRQLGWEVGVLPGFVTGEAPASGHPAPRPRAGVRHLDAGEVRDWIAAGALLLCADPSGLYRQAHPAGAGWINRARLKRIVAGAQGARRLIVTAHEIGLAELVALDLAEATGEAVAVYPGGRASWSRAGLATEASPDSPPDREQIDFLFWLHDRHSGNLEASRAYLDWELGLPAAVGDRRQTHFEIGPDHHRLRDRGRRALRPPTR
ncbi:rhodanese-like domain-containing protein (plasmid) [Methylobacterium sp. NMS12]|uniref:rhodanese-like domain-containing protein n=1 Tax=Methylobacterium sp. NMS12 TaxID=3079766 RepID=UPI003F881D64